MYSGNCVACLRPFSPRFAFPFLLLLALFETASSRNVPLTKIYCVLCISYLIQSVSYDIKVLGTGELS